MSDSQINRRVRLSPYRKGMGPTFTLTTWWVGTDYTHGPKDRLRYELRMHLNGKTTVLFAAADYCCAPGFACDSDEAIGGLLGFLTLKPGDTDPDYFAAYTPEQLDYCDKYAETLMCESMRRFGEDC
jgi:hypothetical protein